VILSPAVGRLVATQAVAGGRLVRMNNLATGRRSGDVFFHPNFQASRILIGQ